MGGIDNKQHDSIMGKLTRGSGLGVLGLGSALSGDKPPCKVTFEQRFQVSDSCWDTRGR